MKLKIYVTVFAGIRGVNMDHHYYEEHLYHEPIPEVTFEDAVRVAELAIGTNFKWSPKNYIKKTTIISPVISARVIDEDDDNGWAERQKKYEMESPLGRGGR